jgi:nitroreductase
MTSASTDTAPIDVLETLLAARHSCRAFRPEPVPRATIERILTAAQKTASWCNSQPWQITITSGEATRKFRDALYPVAASGAPLAGDFEFPREYRGVYLDRRRESGFQLYNTLGIARGDKAGYTKQALENFNFFGAPHAAIITTDEALGVYGAVDCGGYVTNFMMAALALGVASVPQAALAFHSAVVRQHFGLADDRRIVCGLSFGYPDTAHKANSYRTTRAALSEVATFVE